MLDDKLKKEFIIATIQQANGLGDNLKQILINYVEDLAGGALNERKY